jgi:SAM-dependent methyltransferase
VTSPALPYGLSGRDEARAYFDWIVARFGAALAGDVLDHGAGTGALTARLAKRGCRVIALEPDAELLQGLRERFRGDAGVQIMPGTIENYLAERGARSLDAVISCNVLEHLEDDLGCLRLLRESLRPGGALAVYVPARTELFGSLDASVGHVRRYGRRLLRERLEQTGFFVEWLRYGNLAGALPWLVAGRVLKRRAIAPGELGVFDRWIFPLASRLESLVPLPYGLNLAALARRQ